MFAALLHPLFELRNELRFYFDDQPLTARKGETVASAVLRQRTALGRSEFDGSARAGLCLMGACQDCTIWTVTGQRLRACTTLMVEEMRLYSSAALTRK